MNTGRWTLGAEHVELHLPYFDLCSLALTTPSNTTAVYHWIRCTDWVKVIPITESGEFLLLDQFRPVNESQSLEVPGGALEPGETDPIAAAKRELLEETGYSASSFSAIGSFNPNPALFRNRCHVVLALGAKREERQNLEPTERIALKIMNRTELLQALTGGEISHALVQSALLQFLTWESHQSFQGIR